MKKRFFLLCTLASSLFLHSEEKVIELVANFPTDPEGLTRILHSHHIPARVESSDLSLYGDALKRVKSRWIQMLRYLSIDLAPRVEVPQDHAKILFWNLTKQHTEKRELWRLPKEKLVLFMWEPPTVLPQMYAPEATRCFSKIYTWNDALVDNQTYFKFFYPVLAPMSEEIPSFEEKKLCALFCTNLASAHPNELYSERARAIDYFENAQEQGFEFYGKKWDASLHPAYRGFNETREEKLETIRQFRFSICYENIHSIEGYITEKIFDCFAAGNVPIYWGASNIEAYIPKGCFIDKRDFPDYPTLHTFLKNMSKQEYEGYLCRIRAFLESEAAQLFSWHHFEEIFCQAVQDDTDTN